jgi:DNA-binding transcriptional ArsR family regulator
VARRIPLPEALRLFRVLGDETRLRLLLALSRRGEVAVGDLAAAVGLRHPRVSYQLGILRESGLVCYRREGKRHYYRLASPFVAGLLRDVGTG